MKSTKLATLQLVALAVTLLGLEGGCGDREHATSHLDIASADDLTGEQQWLSSLQDVRVVWSTTGEVVEMPTNFFDEWVGWHCISFVGAASSGPGGASCHGRLALDAGLPLCMAKTFLAAAKIQSVPMQLTQGGIDTLEVPEQSEATSAELAESAIRYARWAMQEAIDPLGVPEGTCSGQPWDVPYGGRTGLLAYTSTYVDAYYTARDAYDRAIEATLNASDSMRSTSRDPNKSLARATVGEHLSRAAAAHLMVGGDPGLNGNTDEPLCSTQPLTPQGQTALQLLRDAGIAPDEVLNPNLSLTDLLNGTLPTGSVRQRLGEFYNFTALVPGAQPVESFYDLSLPSFQEAREHLAEEIKAFQRSRTARLPEDPLHPGGWRRYAGTASEPVELPGIVWATRAAYFSDQSSTTEAEDLLSTRYGLRQLIGRGVLEAQFIVDKTEDFPEAARAEGLAPLALLASSPEYKGRIRMSAVSDTLLVYAYGYGLADRVRVVAGEDGLRCAVDGNIEGADCRASEQAPVADYPCDAGDPDLSCLTVGLVNEFSNNEVVIANWDIPSPNADSTFYVVKPKSDSSPELPGHFEVLGSSKGLGHTIMDVVEGLDERVGKALAPSRKHCAVPEVSCADVTFDARLPLEDELTSDTDGVENSWRHYLALARQAANEADLRGQEYLQAELEVTADSVQTEIRREEQIQRAEDALLQVQAACGTAIESRKLINLLSGGSEGRLIINSVETCQTNADCAEPDACVGGRCIVDLGLLAFHNSDDPDMARLARCLGYDPTCPDDPECAEDPSACSESCKADDVEEFVTLGTSRLCVYSSEADPNVVCPEGDDEYQCPARTVTQPNVTCQDDSGCSGQGPWDCVDGKCVGCSPVGGLVANFAEPLGYFEADPPATPGSPCDSLRTLRGLYVYTDPELSSAPELKTLRDEAYANLKSSNILNPASLFEDPKRQLNWHALYGGFSTILDGQVPLYTSGNAEMGANGAWPCVPLYPEKCAAIDALGNAAPGLFCSSANCTDPVARASINERMMKATIAAHLIEYGSSDVNELNINLKLPRQGSLYEKGCGNSPMATYYHYLSGERFFACGQLYERHHPDINSSPTSDGWFDPAGQPISSYGGMGFWAALKPTEMAKFGAISEILGEIPEEWLFESKPTAYGIAISGNGGRWSTEPFFLAGLYDGSEPSSSSVMYKNLVEATAWGPMIDAYSMPEDSLIPDGVLSPGSFLDGLELLCEVEYQSIKKDQVQPSIDENADLASVGAYLQQLASHIEAGAATSVFAQVPRVAFDAMRETSSVGVFPNLGGRMAEEVSALRQAFLQAATAVPVISGTMNQLGAELRTLRSVLELAGIRSEIRDYQLASTIADRLTQCASSVADVYDNATSFGAQGVVQCANAAAQIAIAMQVNQLEQEAADLEGDIATGQASGRISQYTERLQLTALELKQALEQVDARVAAIENLRKQAALALGQTVYQASWQAEKQAEYTGALGTLGVAKQRRYEVALKNAQLMAFTAKRALEQRLGVNLSEMTDDLPFVDAPSTWESKVCTMTGINYASIVGGDDKSFTDGFIGDYVTNLENVVESYRIDNSFHEGRDVAVISLRDDVFNVRRNCQVEGRNLLLEAGQLDNAAFWNPVGCDDDSTLDLPNCIAPVRLQTSPLGLRDPQLSGAPAYRLVFGDGAGCPTGAPNGACTWQPGAALAQTVTLGAGRYRLSWYSQENENTGGADEDMVTVSSPSAPAPALDFEFFEGLGEGEWNRMSVEFVVLEDDEYQIGFGTDATTMPATTVTVAAPMLENLPVIGTEFELPSFQNTSTDRLVSLDVCEDTDGSIFRRTKWTRDCIRLCEAGFSGNCSDGPLYCYREASFGISQSWIESGKIFNYSGFARGNFNYRIENLALNFVGTGIRDCGTEELKSACYSAGFVPYTMLHSGPFFVRNHYGDDFKAYLFDGRIEHARGLATERYITNPLSSADRELLADYVRPEFQGRPLDGNFIIRVWEEPGGDFEAIEDVQLILNYRYWTRNE